MAGFNYECDGQMNIFNIVMDNAPKVIGYCHATLNPCNREKLTEVAQELERKCTARCCAGCMERNECGVACNQSHKY